MIRSFLPIDLVIMPFAGGLLGDAMRAKGSLDRDEGGARFLSLVGLLVPGPSPRERRHAWVSTEWSGCRGLVSVRNRHLPNAWEVERLLLRDRDLKSCCLLLERLSAAGAELGVGKIFLRLPADSSFLPVAKEVGYAPYTTQCLYFRERVGRGPAGCGTPVGPEPRRRGAGDDYRLFRLYQRCVPVTIRRVEGMTFGEWQANRRPSTGQEWVFQKDDDLEGWLGTRTHWQTGQFEVMASTEEWLNRAVEHGLRLVGRRQRIFCLSGAFQVGLPHLLEERGFSQMDKYCNLAKELTARERQAYLIPANA